MDWLKENGVCLDHIVVRNSTIPNAGRGGFASRFLPKGTIVAPVPLIHIPNRSIFNIYDSYVEPYSLMPQYKRNATKVIHHQLLLNYCFGHRQSSLLLCPYGIASSMINHGSKPNLMMVWSNATTSRAEWFGMSVEKWAYTYQAGLAFDYVAIRDIEEGEELLIDYGKEWEMAWEHHISKWTPKTFKSQLLNEMEPPIELPIHTDWIWPDVHLWCRNLYGNTRPNQESDVIAFPCRVIGKAINQSSGEISYMAQRIKRFHGTKGEGKGNSGYVQRLCGETYGEILFDFPRDAFKFGNSFDWAEKHRYYTETWSFRHDLRIPDHLFPDKWKNLMNQ